MRIFSNYREVLASYSKRTKNNRANSTYLVETLELLDRIDRLLASGARLAHLYLLFLLGYGPLPPLSSSRLRVRTVTHAGLLICTRSWRYFTYVFSRHRIKSTHARTHDTRRTHARLYVRTH